MHPQALRTFDDLFARYVVPNDPRNGSGEGRLVYDVGCFDPGENYKKRLERAGWHYCGLDVEAGPNVDIIIPPQPFDGFLRLVDVVELNPELDPLTHFAFEQSTGFFPRTSAKRADLVISGQCLEHVEDPFMFACNIEALLNVGGIAIVQTHAHWPEHRRPVDCWRFYPDGLRVLGERNGLTVLAVGTSPSRNHEGTDCLDSWAVYQR